MIRFNRLSRPACASAAVILVTLVAWPSAAGALECVIPTKLQIENLFVNWNNALQQSDPKNPDAVVNLYATDAVLLPTVETGPYTTHEQIAGYFKHFLVNKPSGTIDRRTIYTGCNVAFDVGLYTFNYGVQPKSPTAARYTYIYKYVNSEWLIAHHHSSVWPPGPPTDPPPLSSQPQSQPHK
jgi:uncharacterized protein (TIGR02246 family)